MAGKQIPVYGQHAFTLGALYDERSEQIVMGQSPWSHSTIENGKSIKQIASSKFEVSVAETLHERCNLMKIEGSLKIGIMCGLVNIEGAGKFLNENTESKKTSRVALYYEKQTRIEELHREVIIKPDYPEVFDEVDATHVVVGVQYGAKAIFDFQKSFNSVEAKVNAEGSLKAKIDKIPKVSVEVEAEGQDRRTETDKDENIQCKYIGDFEMEHLPTTFEDSVLIYRELPNKLSENDSKAVPMVAWLYPIPNLNSKTICREIDDSLIAKCIKVNEDMTERMASINDLRNVGIVSKFPSLLEKLNSFYSKILEPTDMTIKKKLKELIPEVRYGRQDTEGITNLIETIHRSNYSPARLQKWINVKKEEIAFLENLTSGMMGNTNITICTSKADHIRKRKQLDICYKINTEENDVFIENYKDLFQVSEDEIAQCFYSQKEEVMLRMADQINAFAITNKDQNMSFHITEDLHSENVEEPTSISVWKKGRQEELDHLPTEPTNLRILDTGHDTVLLTWDPPEYGAETIEKVILTYCIEGKDDKNTIEIEKTENTAKVENLSPLSTYDIKVSLKTRYGMSPLSEMLVTTKPHMGYKVSSNLRIENCRIVNLGEEDEGYYSGQRSLLFKTESTRSLGDSALKRIKNELKEITKDGSPYFLAGPVGDDLSDWQAIILGPPGTPYEGGVFFFNIHFSQNYPFQNTKFAFATPIFHPNINRQGAMCLEWPPPITVSKMLLSIVSLLHDPIPDDPMVPVIANMYKTDRDKYNMCARDFTRKYAMPASFFWV